MLNVNKDLVASESAVYVHQWGDTYILSFHEVMTPGSQEYECIAWCAILRGDV